MRSVPTRAGVAALSVLIGVFGVFGSLGCSLDTAVVVSPGDVGVSPLDSSGPDAARPDGSSSDSGPRIDGASPDSSVRDSAARDSAAPDSRVPDAAAPCAAWSPQHFDPCAIPPSDLTVDINADGVYDTDSGELNFGGATISVPNRVIDQAGTPARLVSVGSFRVAPGVRLRVQGAMPLIVASWGTIQIEGELDLGSRFDDYVGAGANHASCGGAEPGAGGWSGTGGGGGGGFGGRGGRGGNGDGNPTGGASVRDGGSGGPVVPRPAIVRGGCPGADSGPGVGAVVGVGGAGGGAIQLSARGAVTVRGRVLAGGGGGRGSAFGSAAGGGGAGSGGYIGLEGATVTVSGVLAANGGGGGEGTNLSATGGNGEHGLPSAARAAGGSGGTAPEYNGGAGGAGAVAAGDDVPGAPNGGGGGGGGGVGYVLVWSPTYADSGAVISPPATRP